MTGRAYTYSVNLHITIIVQDYCRNCQPFFYFWGPAVFPGCILMVSAIFFFPLYRAGTMPGMSWTDTGIMQNDRQFMV